jgi:hypothetical protein
MKESESELLCADSTDLPRREPNLLNTSICVVVLLNNVIVPCITNRTKGTQSNERNGRIYISIHPLYTPFVQSSQGPISFGLSYVLSFKYNATTTNIITVC